MKYGSLGFNSFGYQAGCAYANGTLEEAQASPNARRYLCTPEDGGQYVCTHDHVSSAFCFSEKEDYEFHFSASEGLQDINVVGLSKIAPRISEFYVATSIMQKTLNRVLARAQ